MTAALEISTAELATIVIADLQRDPELVCRATGINKGTANEYGEAMKGGAVFPPVVVFTDSKGVHWLADGFHRCAAAELAGLAEIAADRRVGSRKDALLFAASANSAHGLRRTTADKRRSIELLLGNFPKWSDRKIGEASGVDHKTVAATRARLTKPKVEPGEIPHVEPGEPATVEPSDPIENLIAKFRRILSDVPPEHLPQFQNDVLAILSATES